MYWNSVLQECLNKDNPEYPLYYIPCDENRLNNQLKPERIMKQYFLGPKFKGIYFTEREAQAMLGILNGLTYRSIAETMDISNRTVEFYIKNMRCKLRCPSREILIKKIRASDFLKVVDFELWWASAVKLNLSHF